MPLNIASYEISEIFYSIQGEGYFTGQQAIFIRFSGCNLSCSFCDEPTHKEKGTILTIDQLLNKIKAYSECRFIILTGGEPTLQPHFAELVNILQENQYFVAVETNGTNPLNCSPNWVTVSPKTEDFIAGDELKLVYQNQDLKQFEKLPFKHFYIQPQNDRNKLNNHAVKQCLSVVEKNPNWKLSLQIHKVLNIK